MSNKRILIDYGTYHIYNRGHNKMAIFKDASDKKVFLNQIRKSQTNNNFQIFAWDLMTNHYHLLYKDVMMDMPNIIGLIQENFSKHYNKKYNHSGSVFTNPFKSKPIYSYNQFFATFSYIQNNPVKEKMVKLHSDYKWNSPVYGPDSFNITDNLYPNHYFRSLNEMSLNDYVISRSMSREISNLELSRLSDKDAEVLYHNIVKNICIKGNVFDNKNKIIHESKYLGLSTRQISIFSGWPVDYINKINVTKSYI